MSDLSSSVELLMSESDKNLQKTQGTMVNPVADVQNAKTEEKQEDGVSNNVHLNSTDNQNNTNNEHLKPHDTNDQSSINHETQPQQSELPSQEKIFEKTILQVTKLDESAISLTQSLLPTLFHTSNQQQANTDFNAAQGVQQIQSSSEQITQIYNPQIPDVHTVNPNPQQLLNTNQEQDQAYKNCQNNNPQMDEKLAAIQNFSAPNDQSQSSFKDQQQSQSSQYVSLVQPIDISQNLNFSNKNYDNKQLSFSNNHNTSSNNDQHTHHQNSSAQKQDSLVEIEKSSQAINMLSADLLTKQEKQNTNICQILEQFNNPQKYPSPQSTNNNNNNNQSSDQNKPIFVFAQSQHTKQEQQYMGNKNHRATDQSTPENARKVLSIDTLLSVPLKSFSLQTKQVIYDNLISILTKQDREKEVHIIRCTKDIQLPDKISLSHLSENPNRLKVEQHQDTFSYKKPEANDEVHWYLNFADRHVFGFYTSALYAQDELQCTEMPLLPHVKEYIQNQTENHYLSPYTYQNDFPTPILVMNVPRLGTIDIAPDRKNYRSGLYGNNFRQLQVSDIDDKLHMFMGEEKVYTNIIAMAAMGYGHGFYTKDQIEFTLLTAYKSFHQANEYSKQVYGQNKKVVIHTGNWGCGAFGNNYKLMAILQILAAGLAGIDSLQYHTFNQVGTNGFTQGSQIYNNMEELFGEVNGAKGVFVPTERIIKYLVDKQFQWGVSDGN